MLLTLTMAPDKEPVTFEEVVDYLRLPGAPADAMDVEQHIAAARGTLDGRDGYLGRALITQQWELRIDRFEPEIRIPLPPCQAIDSVTYLDREGSEQTLAASDWRAYGLLGSAPARLRPAPGQGWPETLDAPEAVRVAFTAGYGDTPADIPAPIRGALKRIVGDLYANREDLVTGTVVSRLPTGSLDMVNAYRVWEF